MGFNIFGFEVSRSAPSFEPPRSEATEHRNADEAGDGQQKKGSGSLSSLASDDARQVAAVEFAAGLVSRAFMLADVTPSIDALDPETLSMMGREVILNGNAVFAIDYPLGGALGLLPASDFEIYGDVRPNTWRYDVILDSPSGAADIQNIPAAGIMHLRVNAEPGRPWRGVSPIVNASLTAAQLATIEMKLGHEATTRGWAPAPAAGRSHQGAILRHARTDA